MNKYSYNIHDLVKIMSNIRFPENIVPRVFCNSFSFQNPDIIVEVKSRPSASFALEQIKDCIYVSVPSFRGLLGPAASGLVFSLIMISLIKKGFTFIHAGAVEKNRKAQLFIASPDTGKTFTTLSLIKNGFNYLSDDEVITDGGAVLSYPTKMTFHHHHLDLIKLNSQTRCTFLIKGYINKIPFIRYIMPPFLDITGITSECTISPMKVIPQFRISNCARLSRIFFLEKSSHNEVLCINSKKAYYKARVYTFQDVQSPFHNPQLLKYAPWIYEQMKFEVLEEREKEIFKKMCKTAKCIVLRAHDVTFFPTRILDEIF